jgi:hypothetical protein
MEYYHGYCVGGCYFQRLGGTWWEYVLRLTTTMPFDLILFSASDEVRWDIKYNPSFTLIRLNC